MVEIIKLAYHDDSDASTSVEIMVCSSIDAAKEILLKKINKDFEGNWASLKEAASELKDDLEYCDMTGTSFTWLDNGKGETYHIGSVNVREVNTKFQVF